MTPVQFLFVTPDGVPIANTEFEVQLSKSSYWKGATGVLMPRRIYGFTDSFGRATIELWPNSVAYHLIMEDPESCACVHYLFKVPNTGGLPVRFQDIIVLKADDDVPGAETSDELLMLSLKFLKLQVADTNAKVLAATAAIRNTLP